jgi:phospholipid transport system substrate-binding protein
MRLLALVFSLFFAAAASAQQQPAQPQPAQQPAAPAAQAAQKDSPEELVKQVTNDVLNSIKSDTKLQAGDKKKALQLAEQKILPHVDFKHAAQLAVGRPWNTATPEQQDKITSEFRAMLVRIYSNAIDTYRGQTMKVLPVRVQPGANEATVKNQYNSPNGQPVIVEYAMHKKPEGWKIYDITVEGVSLVLTYRAEFENVTRTSGVDGLIKKLQEKNA